MYNKVKRATKANYYHVIIEENKFNMKKTWTVLNEVIGRKNDKSNFAQEFIIGGNSVKNKTIIAESFNDYFSKIGHETGQNVPSTDVNYSDFYQINIHIVCLLILWCLVILQTQPIN